MGANLERGSLLHKRYRIVEILGQGGMGSVYRAVDENLGVDVAVKENLFTSDEYARQFRLEAVILANLRHANLPRVTDHFVIGDQGQYLIMDYIDGEDLRQRMERTGSISEEEAILVGAAMCDALQYLHTRKPSIIHRDLKPGNVRITPDGHIYLVDFGLAKLVKGSQATTTGARAMTPGYSPPEQYGTARTDSRTDIYSLGATLYAALTGVIPEDGLARAMDNVELTPLRKHNPKVSRKLAAAIEEAMAIRPEDRFQSAEDFRQALLTSNVKTRRLEGEIVVDPPSQAPGPGEDGNFANEMPGDTGNGPSSPPPSEPRKKVRSTSWWIFFSFFLLAIVLALLSIFIFWSPITKAFLGLLASSTSTSIPTPSPGTPTFQALNTLPPPPPQGKTATPQPSLIVTRTPLPTFMPSITPTPTETLGPTPTSLGGGYSQIAFASDRTGIPQIYLMNANGGEPQQVTNMSYGACQPAWSTDGVRLVFISPCQKRLDQYPGAKMYVINADGSGLISLVSGEGGDFDPAWSPAGSHIAFTSLRDGSPQIYVLNLGDNSVTRLTEASNDVRQPDWSAQPDWSPSGTQIVYTGHGPLTNALQIWVMSDAGQDQTFLIHRGSDLWNFLPDWSPDGKTLVFSETSGNQQLGWLMLFDYEHQIADAVHLRMQAYGTHSDYSPDGIWIAYESLDIQYSDRRDYDIYRMKADGTGAIIRLTNSPSMEFDPAWRPIVTP
jgi:serine/threonine protein kinase/Tol biopolymer transport system component